MSYYGHYGAGYSVPEAQPYVPNTVNSTPIGPFGVTVASRDQSYLQVRPQPFAHDTCWSSTNAATPVVAPPLRWASDEKNVPEPLYFGLARYSFPSVSEEQAKRMVFQTKAPRPRHLPPETPKSVVKPMPSTIPLPPTQTTPQTIPNIAICRPEAKRPRSFDQDETGLEASPPSKRVLPLDQDNSNQIHAFEPQFVPRSETVPIAPNSTPVVLQEQNIVELYDPFAALETVLSKSTEPACKETSTAGTVQDESAVLEAVAQAENTMLESSEAMVHAVLEPSTQTHSIVFKALSLPSVLEPTVDSDGMVQPADIAPLALDIQPAEIAPLALNAHEVTPEDNGTLLSPSKMLVESTAVPIDAKAPDLQNSAASNALESTDVPNDAKATDLQNNAASNVLDEVYEEMKHVLEETMQLSTEKNTSVQNSMDVDVVPLPLATEPTAIIQPHQDLDSAAMASLDTHKAKEEIRLCVSNATISVSINNMDHLLPESKCPKNSLVFVLQFKTDPFDFGAPLIAKPTGRRASSRNAHTESRLSFSVVQNLFSQFISDPSLVGECQNIVLACLLPYLESRSISRKGKGKSKKAQPFAATSSSFDCALQNVSYEQMIKYCCNKGAFMVPFVVVLDSKIFDECKNRDVFMREYMIPEDIPVQ